MCGRAGRLNPLSTPRLSASELIQLLDLSPHPEGGHYRETYRAPTQVDTLHGPRPASTAILFLLAEGEQSCWHRIRSDELWHHHAGGALLIHELRADGTVRQTRLGMDLDAGQIPQHVVPAGHWFAAELIDPTSWVLVGCTVAPGFDFADFELAAPEQLTGAASSLARLCRGAKPQCQA